MASSERPHYLPPLKVRSEAGQHDEDDAGPGPLPRTASSVHSGGVGSGTGLSRSTSGASRARSTQTGQGSHAPRSPSAYSTTFTIPSSSGHHATSQAPPPSSTHAGGIQPSASFFHPSRPTYYTDFSPMSQFIPGSNALNVMPLGTVTRSTSVSHHGDPRPESGGSDSFAQASFTSEEPAPGTTSRERSDSASQATAAISVNRGFSMKKSREPLLPIGQKPKSTVPIPRPGVNASASATKLPGIGSYGKWGDESTGGEEGGFINTFGTGAGGRVRTSFEKFLRRTLSNDTQMAQDTSYVKDSMQPLEDLEARGRKSEDPYMEFKASPDLMFDEEGTMDITRHNGTAPSTISRRQLKSVQRTHFPDFNPVLPATTPPLARTPKLDSSGKPIRKYQLHPSSNTFFLKGKLLTGGDSIWPFVCSLALVFGLTGVWSGVTAVWWWKNESPAVAIIGAYLCLITIANMMGTAFSDPGILPRNLDPDPPYPQNASSEEAARAPLPRDLKVRSGVVRVKYCQTCRIYRPPRSSHCRMCDNCVDGCDHHCQWLNNCVGRRNYTSFILFLTSVTLTLCFMICTSALHLVIHANRDHISAGKSLNDGAGSAVVFVVCAIVIWPVGGLLGYHIRLLLLNLTTIEQIRNSAHKSLINGPPPPNPFALGNWRHNLAEMLCRGRGMSWLSASDYATEDKRLPNPGAEIKS
ncbi:ERF2 [Sanghuangporus sanghuang]